MQVGLGRVSGRLPGVWDVQSPFFPHSELDEIHLGNVYLT